jgi:hypothetical protein
LVPRSAAITSITPIPLKSKAILEQIGSGGEELAMVWRAA